MKLVVVLLLVVSVVGCGGYGSNYNSMTNGGAPTITGFMPTSATHGTAFTLTVNGTGFTTGSIVYWGPTTPINATYMSGTAVSVNITAVQNAAAGMIPVYVHSAGGNSNTVNFPVN